MKESPIEILIKKCSDSLRLMVSPLDLDKNKIIK
jgi:hypothetical protein